MEQGKSPVAAWRVSLHGGHSGEFCDHAQATLREMLQAAVDAGYHTFGVSEHAPRGAERFLYDNEKLLGWDTEKVAADFDRYCLALPPLVEEFADRLIVLRGFETEVVPQADYARRMEGYRARTLPDGRPLFDYYVGSVHYVDEMQIDGEAGPWREAAEAFGGPEALAIRYYDTVTEMVTTLRPEVVGHLDLIKKKAQTAGFGTVKLDTPRIRAAAERSLEAVRAIGGILDLNTAGWRKGLGEPYPAPWLVARAQAMEVPFCFGDDSHQPAQVGEGVGAARDYLLQSGVRSVTVLTREGDRVNGPVVKRVVPLS